MLSELFAIVSQVGVYPILAVLYVKLVAAQKSHEELLNFLKETCPACGHVHIFTGKG